jgi:hypothetical protein
MTAVSLLGNERRGGRRQFLNLDIARVPPCLMRADGSYRRGIGKNADFHIQQP